MVQKKKPHAISCVSVKPWLHSYIHIWVSSSWTLRILRILSLRPIATLEKEQGFPNPVSDCGIQKTCFKASARRSHKGSNPITNLKDIDHGGVDPTGSSTTSLKGPGSRYQLVLRGYGGLFVCYEWRFVCLGDRCICSLKA